MNHDFLTSLNTKTSDNLPSSFSQIGNNNIQTPYIGSLTINNNSTSKIFFNSMFDDDFDDFFVKTNIYIQLTKYLEEMSVVILIGQPGVGKTITSKRVANDYALKGYRILYSEEGNIANARYLLNEINPQDKTLIILNDFLGQFYTGLRFDEKSEISGLVTSIKHFKNIKLLINTRGIIYKEAMQCEKFNDTIENNSNFIQEIQTGELSIDERALILLNHLKRAYKNGFLSSEHYFDILKERAYGKIVLHKNFNPRIIEHLTRKKFITKTNPSDFTNQIFNTLENPAAIWQEEYEELDEFDRICLNTLFSLTNTNVPISVLKECFDIRKKTIDKDSTINHFEKSINRLIESLINVFSVNGEQRIGIINPSLNDFLFGYLTKNKIEMDKILKNSLYYEQIDKLMTCGVENNKLVKQINLGILSRLKTFSKQIFSDHALFIAPPCYLHILKILLIYLKENELTLCGIQKKDIENFVESIFKDNYERIEADARLYFAYELSEIFVMLLKSSNSYDLIEIVNTEKYIDVIINSIARHDDFWELIVGIRNKYFCTLNEEFYKLINIETCIIERISSEVITDTYDDILAIISSDIDDNYDELESFDDYGVITQFVLDDISCDIYELIENSIRAKLEEHSLDSISGDSFDINSIIDDQINIYDIIEDEFDKIKYKQSVDFKENIEKSVNYIVALFEDATWITLDK